LEHATKNEKILDFNFLRHTKYQKVLHNGLHSYLACRQAEVTKVSLLLSPEKCNQIIKIKD